MTPDWLNRTLAEGCVASNPAWTDRTVACHVHYAAPPKARRVTVIQKVLCSLTKRTRGNWSTRTSSIGMLGGQSQVLLCVIIFSEHLVGQGWVVPTFVFFFSLFFFRLEITEHFRAQLVWQFLISILPRTRWDSICSFRTKCLTNAAIPVPSLLNGLFLSAHWSLYLWFDLRLTDSQLISPRGLNQ